MTAPSGDDAFAARLAALIDAFKAAGREILGSPDGREAWRRANELRAALECGEGRTAWLRARGATWIKDAEGLSLGELARELGMSKSRAQQFEQLAREQRGDYFARPEEDPLVPEPQPVVAAIVTSARGVLIARRNDGKPPWTFIAGEIEPGEAPADAAVREVKEETGLEVSHGKIIGRRVHPKTGRTMIYMSAEPVRSTEVFVGDEDELAEVRWASLAEAEDLMQPYGMFEPVREFLARALKG